MLGHVPFSLKYFGSCRTYISTTTIRGFRFADTPQAYAYNIWRSFFGSDFQGLLNVNTSIVCMGESYEA